MSYTEIYKFKKNGDAECFANVKNSFRGAMAIWGILEKRYLPEYRPSWATNASMQYSRILNIFDDEDMEEIWELFDSDEISETDNIVLGTTFDKVVVMKKDLPEVIAAFRAFDGETSLKEQADIIENAYQNDNDLIAIAWNQTSVNGDAWTSDVVETNEDGDEICLPYNLLRDKGHWDLFEED